MYEYEWNEIKRKKNIEKHFLDFIDAIKVFDDNDRIDRIDSRNKYTEIRHQTIGKIKETDLIVLVVWTFRDGKRRIISARPAHTKERRKYHEKQN